MSSLSHVPAARCEGSGLDLFCGCACCAGVLASLDEQAAQLAVQALFRLARDEGAKFGNTAAGDGDGIRDALAAAFERGPEQAPYVGALQRLALEDAGSAVEASKAAEAARASGSLQAGALQVGAGSTPPVSHSLHVHAIVLELVMTMILLCYACQMNASFKLRATEVSTGGAPAPQGGAPLLWLSEAWITWDCAGALLGCYQHSPHDALRNCVAYSLQIEEALLGGAKASATAQPPPQKRRRTADDAFEPAVSGDEGAWDALASLYRDLGEDHLAHTSFAAHVARLGFFFLAPCKHACPGHGCGGIIPVADKTAHAITLAPLLR